MTRRASFDEVDAPRLRSDTVARDQLFSSIDRSALQVIARNVTLSAVGGASDVFCGPGGHRVFMCAEPFEDFVDGGR